MSGSSPWALTLPQTAPSVAILTGSGVTVRPAMPSRSRWRQPGGLVGEVPLGMLRQAGDHRARQGTLAHVGQGLGVDHVVA